MSESLASDFWEEGFNFWEPQKTATTIGMTDDLIINQCGIIMKCCVKIGDSTAYRQTKVVHGLAPASSSAEGTRPHWLDGKRGRTQSPHRWVPDWLWILFAGTSLIHRKETEERTPSANRTPMGARFSRSQLIASKAKRATRASWIIPVAAKTTSVARRCQKN